jgi:hypothetical protein
MRLMPFNSATIDQFTLTLLGSRIARCSCLAACLPPSVARCMGRAAQTLGAGLGAHLMKLSRYS